MIYDFQKVIVVSFTNEKDIYGQKRVGESDRREVDMMIKPHIQMNVSDVRFVDATDIGLTRDTAITDANQIISSTGTTYNVLYTIPSKRLTQVFLKKVN